MLLDTHVVLWVLTDDPRLQPHTRNALAHASRLWVSAASIWEMSIKASLGKLAAPEDLLIRIDQAGMRILKIDAEHAWGSRQISGLPHRDPFDRLLLTQAVTERMPFLTADRAILHADLQPSVTVIDARA